MAIFGPNGPARGQASCVSNMVSENCQPDSTDSVYAEIKVLSWPLSPSTSPLTITFR
jgi:hypothetical protein